MNKPIYVNTNSDGMGTPENPIQPFGPNNLCGIDDYDRFDRDHPALPTYSQNNELIVNSRVEITLEPQGLYGTLWLSITEHAYKQFKINPKGYQFSETRRIYRQVAIKEEKATTEESSEVEEKELYYCLSDNGDLNGLYLASMRDVSEHIEMDLGDIEPSDRENVQYTITPVYLTQTEFNNLPEYEG